MDVDDLFDWLQWGLLAFAFVAMVLVVLMLIFMGIVEVIYRLRRRSKAPLSTDQLLPIIPDVPYKEKEISPTAAAADDDRDTCVICQAAYEVDDRCSVLPKCKHMFHKPCIATWLRKHVTCPLCRAIVVASIPEQQKKLNAAENMV